MSAVIVCLLALRDRFGSHVGEGLHCSLEENGRMPSMEFSIRENGHSTQNSGFGEESKQARGNLQKVSKSPGPSGEIFSTCQFFFRECVGEVRIFVLRR